MAQNENYSQVDLRVGTEAQFNAKVDTLPAGTLFGVTDATVSKADLSTDLKNEINDKISKPTNPSADSAIIISSTGTVSTKVLTDIAGKSEVSVSSSTPTGDEVLWINPDGTGGGSSSGGGKLYLHKLIITVKSGDTTQGAIVGKLLSTDKENLTEITVTQYKNLFDVCGYKSSLTGLCYLTNQQMMDFAAFDGGIYNFIGYAAGDNTYPFKQTYSGVFSGTSYTVTDTVTEL